jgi:hypothetical protein
MLPMQKGCACVNIAHALTRGMGWGSREPPEPAYEETGVKPALNAGSPQASAVGSSLTQLHVYLRWKAKTLETK